MWSICMWCRIFTEKASQQARTLPQVVVFVLAIHLKPSVYTWICMLQKRSMELWATVTKPADLRLGGQQTLLAALVILSLFFSGRGGGWVLLHKARVISLLGTVIDIGARNYFLPSVPFVPRFPAAKAAPFLHLQGSLFAVSPCCALSPARTVCYGWVAGDGSKSSDDRHDTANPFDGSFSIASLAPLGTWAI